MHAHHLPLPRLGVNVDHVATLRQARGTLYPDPVTAAALAELAGADQITIHLREDRRHIQDRDLLIMRQTVQTRLNLEMAASDEMVQIALRTKPHMVTLVPERREERTTEGGLDAHHQREHLAPRVKALQGAGIQVSLFIAADPAQLHATRELGATHIELHTGEYCEAPPGPARDHELDRLRSAALLGHDLGLKVAAGHGLDYKNVLDVAALRLFEEFNIGHSIVSRAVMVGFERAVREMIDALRLGWESAP
jgi:pyridoxine 5-phosphate synthase